MEKSSCFPRDNDSCSYKKKWSLQFHLKTNFELCKVVLLHLNVLIESLSVTTQVKATEQHFRLLLFILLYKVVLAFELEDEILQCDHSSESYSSIVKWGFCNSFITGRFISSF